MRKQQAFTIVELIIVITVIAILVAVSVVAYNGIQQRAAGAALVTDLKSAADQLDIDRAQNGAYPASTSAADNNQGLTISKGTTFQYTSTGSSYCLTATSDRNGVSGFMVSSDNTKPREGVCAGHNEPGPSTTYAIGDTGPGGGIIFYDAGSVQSWGRYLEAAPNGWNDGNDPQVTWGCYGTSISGADGTAIGTGKQNTADIISGCSESGIAARIATAYTGGGKSDWFVPSKDELSALYAQKAVVGGFTTSSPGNYYWSSSEDTTYYAKCQRFSDGLLSTYDKSRVDYRLRPIRAF